MGTLGKLLQERRHTIAQRWLECALEAYSPEGSKLFDSQKDPFANPVGHSLRTGMPQIIEALLEGGQQEMIREGLVEIIKIRAVQHHPASQAVSFVFGLKSVMRAQAGEAAEDPQLLSEWAEMDRRIDGIALTAFDIFVECREQVSELRVSEVKRQVSWIIEKLNRQESDAEESEVGPA